MIRELKKLALLPFMLFVGASGVLAATPTFVCQEPGGKRLLRIDAIDGRTISR
jgi:hypothetical protein